MSEWRDIKNDPPKPGTLVYLADEDTVYIGLVKVSQYNKGLWFDGFDLSHCSGAFGFLGSFTRWKEADIPPVGPSTEKPLSNNMQGKMVFEELSKFEDEGFRNLNPAYRRL